MVRNLISGVLKCFNDSDKQIIFWSCTNLISNYLGCIKTIILKGFRIVLKVYVIQLTILQILFKSPVTEHEIYVQSLETLANLLLFN